MGFDLTANSLLDFVIEALVQTSSSPSICEEIEAALDTYEKRPIACRPDTVGSIVRIRLTGTKKRRLALCEVEVYGGNVMQYILLSMPMCVGAGVRGAVCLCVFVCTSSISFHLTCVVVRLTAVSVFCSVDVTYTLLLPHMSLLRNQWIIRCCHHC